jgi:hypothetical protein
MPKLRGPPPPGIMKHLVVRFRDGRIHETDFLGLKHWLESNPDVPEGMWYKRFNRFTLAGEGELVKTFLGPRMAVKGTELE